MGNKNQTNNINTIPTSSKLQQPSIPKQPHITNKQKFHFNQERTNFFTQAMHPRIISGQDIATQVPNSQRQQLVPPTMDQTQHIGGNFSKQHNAIRLRNVNANTLLTHNDYSELHKLYWLIST